MAGKYLAKYRPGFVEAEEAKTNADASGITASTAAIAA